MEDKFNLKQFITEGRIYEDESFPDEVLSRHGDISFKKVWERDGKAKYELLDNESGEVWEQGGRIYSSVEQLKDAAADLVKPQGGRQSSQFEESDTRISPEYVKEI